MMRSGHSIRLQRLELEADSERGALALQPLLPELNRRRFLPLIEALLDEFAQAGRRLRIDRLEVDLGTLPRHGFERLAEERLGPALREALERALPRARTGAAVRSLSEQEAHLELLEHYLRQGTVPFWAAAGEFSFEALLLEMCRSRPQAVVALVRRRGRQRRVLERIAAQLGQPALEKLIALLDPEHAAVIVGYIASLRAVHGVEPVLPLSDDDFGRALWVLTQVYLVQDPGSVFNRRSFVKSLLRGLAQSEGLEYTAILAALRIGLAHAGRRLSIHVSLPALVDDLVREARLDETPAAAIRSHPETGLSLETTLPSLPALPLLEAALLDALRPPAATDAGRRHSPRELLQALLSSRPEDARQLLLALEHAPDLRRRLVQHLPPALFERVLRLLHPEQAEMLEAVLDALMHVPGPYRPADAVLRDRILAEALRPGEPHRLGSEAFAVLLRDLFGGSLSEPVRHALSEQAATWSGPGGPPAAPAAAFRTALRAAAPDGPPEAAPRPRASGPAADVDRSWLPALRRFLRGDRPRRRPGGSAREGRATPERPSAEDLCRALDALLAQAPEELEAELQRLAADRRAREHWARALPEATLARVLQRLQPSRHRALLDAAEVLAAAWSDVAPAGEGLDRADFWSFLLEFVARHPEAGSMERLVAAFLERCLGAPAPPGERAPDGRTGRLLEAAERQARTAGLAPLAAALARLAAAAGRTKVEAAPPRPPRRQRAAFGMDGEREDDGGEAVYVANAGLVVAGPFLPHLLQALDLLVMEEGGRVRLRDERAAGRAVHLLQYLVDGRTDAPEPLLALNKILCGLSPAAPVPKAVELREDERAAGDRLLKSLLSGWTCLSNTSVAGLRETFLQREGRLTRSPEGWRLAVQRKTLDVLVDQIPWSVSIVYHRWMAQPLYVTW
jgi:hypothetical protein